ncbi:hypothetical protein BB560_002839 [Smittium megazygosporum]|uniref:Sulfurtransferase n=1 Tax=Smittium megazygosporum TaxID=133381 RepID=A0A2T9ZDL8_9FUNG|nr:hypothetical protein BB560_002839 [Smittium megazygosporum]
MSNLVAENSRFCSALWLSKNLNNVKIIDASWYLPTMKRNTQNEFLEKRIPSSIFFDIDGVKDQSSDLPHMLPSEQTFNKFMDDHGISNDDTIVFYDSHGFMGACRAMWSFEALGHSDVKILEGGLKDWVKATNSIESGPFKRPEPSAGYSSSLVKDLVVSKSQILEAVNQLIKSNGLKGPQIIDARPAARFDGKEAEPRPGLTCGHMPFSMNIPFTELFKPSVNGGAVCKSSQELNEIFNSQELMIDLHNKPIITTCGSGITAACLYVALKHAGAESVSVYDGSWSEYGLDPTNPVVSS